MLTFSVNIDFLDEIDRIAKMVDHKLSPVEREYLSDFVLHVLNDQIILPSAAAHRNTVRKFYSWVRSKQHFDLLAKVKTEVNIITQAELNSGHRRGIPDVKLPSTDTDRYNSTESVIDALDRAGDAQLWWDTYAKALMKFGINIVKCLSLADRGILTAKAQEAFVEVIDFYDVHELVGYIAKDEELRQACMDEDAFNRLLAEAKKSGCTFRLSLAV